MSQLRSQPLPELCNIIQGKL